MMGRKGTWIKHLESMAEMMRMIDSKKYLSVLSKSFYRIGFYCFLSKCGR